MNPPENHGGLSEDSTLEIEPADPAELQAPFDDRLFLTDHKTNDEDNSCETFFPPTDPVLLGGEILGGFSRSSMEGMEVEACTLDGCVGDEALADAVRRELRQDAATADLDIEVAVDDRVAYLRGGVPGIEDAENAEEVAGRLPEVSDVVEELDIQPR